MNEYKGDEKEMRVQSLRIYIDEAERYQNRPLYQALLEMFNREGVAGATVLRAVNGFGGRRLLQFNLNLLADPSPQMPIIIEVIEQAEILARLRPQIEEMVTQGLITAHDVEIWKYSYQRPLRELPPDVIVERVMNQNLTTVQPDTSVAEIVQILIEQNFKALPVVDSENRLNGIITESDLLERGEVPLRLSVLETLNQSELDPVLKRLRSNARTASDIMTARLVTVKKQTLLREAASLMVARKLKRLPVITDDGKLAGMLGRLDVLKVIAQTRTPAHSEKPNDRPDFAAASSAREIMTSSVASVQPDTPVADVLDYLVASELQEVLVVDEQNKLLGVITDADLVERVNPQAQPSILKLLAQGFGLTKAEPGIVIRETARTARDVMSDEVISTGPDEPLENVVKLILKHRVKLLPVVDSDGKLLGSVGRNELLQAVSERLTQG